MYTLSQIEAIHESRGKKQKGICNILIQWIFCMFNRCCQTGMGRGACFVWKLSQRLMRWARQTPNSDKSGRQVRRDSHSLLSWLHGLNFTTLNIVFLTAIQTAIRLHVEGKKSLHKDLKLKRREQREQREKRRQAKEEELQRLRALQEERERKLAELELLKEAQKQAQVLLEQDEQRRRQQHEQLQQALEIQLREAEEVSVRRRIIWHCETKQIGVTFFVSSCAPEGPGQHASRNGSERGGSREAEEEDPWAGGHAEAFGGGAAAGDQSQAGWGGLPLSSNRVLLHPTSTDTLKYTFTPW